MLDRALQRIILERMRDYYPDSTRSVFEELPGTDEAKIANLMYLEEHGLCDSGIIQGMDGHYSWGPSKITARGLDFLADDGGLSAILDTVVVKLHADTIRGLIEAKIESCADLPAPEKASLKKSLANLPATALQAATNDLLAHALDHLPDVVQWLRTLAGL